MGLKWVKKLFSVFLKWHKNSNAFEFSRFKTHCPRRLADTLTILLKRMGWIQTKLEENTSN